MNLELFGAGCFGAVIGFVSWHVFITAGSSLDVKQLGAFIAALLGAAVLAVFPSGTTLFASYATGLALGFFFTPLARGVGGALSRTTQELNFFYDPAPDYAEQLKYLEEHWTEADAVIREELARRGGALRSSHLAALPLSDMGRMAALRKYARTYPQTCRAVHSFWGIRLESRASALKDDA